VWVWVKTRVWRLRHAGAARSRGSLSLVMALCVVRREPRAAGRRPPVVRMYARGVFCSITLTMTLELVLVRYCCCGAVEF